jgi:hypothetical protein
MKELEKNTDYKVNKAKDIVDERSHRMDEQHREHERRLDRLDNQYYSYDRRSINKEGGLEPSHG